MPNASNLAARVSARIKLSPHRLTITYPKTVATPASVSPTPTAPVSPLTGVKAAPVLAPATGTPTKPAVTLTCLWYDTPAMTELRQNDSRAEALGWVVGSDALAVVTMPDGALDVTKPSSGTVFDDCDYVTHDGNRFEVLGAKPVGPAFALPSSYYVWLKGAKGQ